MENMTNVNNLVRLRSEGHARPASAGMMFGGILNVVLDPVFIFVFHLNVAGAAIATALSNAASVVFFAIQYIRLRGRTDVSLHPRHFTFRFIRPIFSVGLASALATALGNASNMVMVHLASGYGDIPSPPTAWSNASTSSRSTSPWACVRVSCRWWVNNYAAKNYERMRRVSTFSWKAAVNLSVGFVTCFAAFASQILHLFIPEAQTSSLGAQFLRVACLAVPLTSVNFLISYTLQAMGKGVQSACLTACRQGLLNIPLLIAMNVLIGLFGMIWTQFVVEIIMLPVSLGMYMHVLRSLKASQAQS